MDANQRRNNGRNRLEPEKRKKAQQDFFGASGSEATHQITRSE